MEWDEEKEKIRAVVLQAIYSAMVENNLFINSCGYN